MASYLEEYGAGEERREKIIKRVLLVVLLLAVISGSAYLFFRNYFEIRRANHFFALVRSHNYRSAYTLWCPPSKPCPGYSFDRFLEDWGPKGVYGDLSTMRVVKTRGCADGVIIQIDLGKGGEDVYLWVSRQDKLLGFAPWPVCNPSRLLPNP
jgi:hypothetical protein